MLKIHLMPCWRTGRNKSRGTVSTSNSYSLWMEFSLILNYKKVPSSMLFNLRTLSKWLKSVAKTRHWPCGAQATDTFFFRLKHMEEFCPMCKGICCCWPTGQDQKRIANMYMGRHLLLFSLLSKVFIRQGGVNVFYCASRLPGFLSNFCAASVECVEPTSRSQDILLWKIVQGYWNCYLRSSRSTVRWEERKRQTWVFMYTKSVSQAKNISDLPWSFILVCSTASLAMFYTTVGLCSEVLYTQLGLHMYIHCFVRHTL